LTLQLKHGGKTGIKMPTIASTNCCGSPTQVAGSTLYPLATAATHFFVSTCTYMSEEVHQSFFNNWFEKMTSIEEQFIFFPSDDESLTFVCNEYSQLGLPGCVGSVDCVHVG
jgi:hypothetical protein